MVNMLDLYSDDPSSNPAEVYSNCLKRTIIHQKRPRMAHFSNVEEERESPEGEEYE